MGWYASMRVDGKPYYLMGLDTAPNSTLANQTSVVVTPTRSSYLYTAGPVIANLTFLSPIEVRMILFLFRNTIINYFSYTWNFGHDGHDELE